MHCFHFSAHSFAGRDGLGEANETKYPDPNAAILQAANLWASALKSGDPFEVFSYHIQPQFMVYGI